MHLPAPALPSEPLETQILRRWMGDESRWVVSEQLLAEYAALLIERGGRPNREYYAQLRRLGRSFELLSRDL